MSFFQSPQYFGIEDHTVEGAEPFRVRIYYPTDDDVIVGAPLPPGPHPLVVFAHGYRGGAQPAPLCPLDRASDNCRWTLVLGAIARSGFVVAAPALRDASSATVPRITATVQWMRSQWRGRRTLHHPPVLNADISGAPGATGNVGEAAVGAGAYDLPAEAAATHVTPPLLLGAPTPLGLVGHSWGARACALVAADGGVQAFAAIAGTFDADASIEALRTVRIPTLLMAGTADVETFTFLQQWPSHATPKYQAAFQSAGHWDWFGRTGAIRFCDGSPPTWPDTGHIAGELLAGFLTRHLAGVQFTPPPLLRIPLLRPWMSPWFDLGSAIQVRWDAPGEQFPPLPPAGDGILGPWTQSPPW